MPDNRVNLSELVRQALEKRGQLAKVALDMKFMKRSDMMNVIKSLDSESSSDYLMDEIMQLANMYEYDPNKEYDEGDRDEIEDTMDSRVEAIAMVASVAIIERAKWNSEKQGVITGPEALVDSVEFFFDKMQSKLSAIIQQHVNNMRRAAQEARAERPTGDREYCFEGCTCSHCERLRAEHTAKFGGEVVQIEQPGMSA